MTTTIPAQISDPARIILHPTDFSSSSELAFAHALRLAVTNKAQLTLVHVGNNVDEDWHRFPHVRELLQRWGMLEPGAQRSEIYTKLGVEIEKIIIRKSNIVASLAEYQAFHPVDLLVVATEQRQGLGRWFDPSTAEKTARKLAIPTLFVPAEGRSCVSLQDGRVTMAQVLVPVDHDPPAGAAVERGLRAIAAFGHEESKLTLLYVGEESNFPDIAIPSGSWKVDRIARQGNPATEILAAARETAADLLAMVTKGPDGFLDVLRGTTTEQVLRQSPCPVLAIPAAENELFHRNL